MSAIRITLALLIATWVPVFAAEPEKKVDTLTGAAEELLTLLHADTMMTQAMDVVLKAQMEQNPDLVKVEDIMRGFLARYLSYDALKPDLLRMYTDAFTEPELREMIAFYRTSTGRKCVDLMPALLQKGASLGVERVNQHADELKAAVVARLKEIEPAPPKPASND